MATTQPPRPPIRTRPVASGVAAQRAPVLAAPRNGMGITSLVLGLVGIVVGLVPLLAMFTAILAVLAVTFGLIGVSRARHRVATNKKMAISGTVLGVLSLVLSVIGYAVVNDAFDDLGRQIGSPTTATAAPVAKKVTPQSTTSEAPEAAADGTARFGTTYRYPDGVTITVSKPKLIRPRPLATPNVRSVSTLRSLMGPTR